MAQGLDALVKVARDQLSAAASDASLADLLADKGLTTTRAAAAYSAQLSKAATGHAEARSGVDAGQAALDELDGRLRNELVRLRRAVQQARRNGGEGFGGEAGQRAQAVPHAEDEPRDAAARPARVAAHPTSFAERSGRLAEHLAGVAEHPVSGTASRRWAARLRAVDRSESARPSCTFTIGP